jgi:diadenosine tetraphosphate (Ap4A) HIT family hydrolase
VSDEDGCPICEWGFPLGIVGERSTVWVTAGGRVPLRGYSCVVAKRHVVEPWQLPDPERTAFWLETLEVARLLDELVRPAKMNYEIHGNTIPHLHVQLFPRFPGDLFEGGPIDGRARLVEWAEGELESFRSALSA